MSSSMNIHADSAREAVLRCINDGLVDDCLPEIGKAILNRTRGITGDPKVDILAAIKVLDAELTELLTDPTAQKRRVVRTSIEMHGKLERLKDDLDEMDHNDPKYQEIKEALRLVVERLLYEAFKYKP